jgi:hypothetical protein
VKGRSGASDALPREASEGEGALTDAERRLAALEEANRNLAAYIRTLRGALAPFARVGRTVTPEMAAADASGWLAHAKRAAEAHDGKQQKGRAA